MKCCLPNYVSCILIYYIHKTDMGTRERHNGSAVLYYCALNGAFISFFQRKLYNLIFYLKYYIFPIRLYIIKFMTKRFSGSIVYSLTLWYILRVGSCHRRTHQTT